MGKTRLSVAYKDLTKASHKGKHAGVYYNAYSEDLFVWNNDDENVNLNIIESSFDDVIKGINDEKTIREKLSPYNPNYDFKLIPRKADDPESSWGSVMFFLNGTPDKPIKISRGEERIFVWCFFLALFELDGWSDKLKEHIFIDDPVASLDDHNIYITARLILELFEKHCDSKKIILTTHHMELFSILQDWLKKGDNASKFKIKRFQSQTKNNNTKEKEVIEDKYLIRFLEKENNDYKLIGSKNGTVLYHLLLIQIVNDAIAKDELYTFHFVLLRQIMESVASFLGEARFSYLLDKLNITDPNYKADIINSLSHEKIYSHKLSQMVGDNKKLFIDVFDKLKTSFPFSIE